MKWLILILLGIVCLVTLKEPVTQETDHVETGTVVGVDVSRQSGREVRGGRSVCVASGESGGSNATETELLDFAIHAIHHLESKCGTVPDLGIAGPYGELGEYQTSPIWWADSRRLYRLYAGHTSSSDGSAQLRCARSVGEWLAAHYGGRFPAHEVGAFDEVLCRRLVRLYLTHYGNASQRGDDEALSIASAGDPVHGKRQVERLLRIYNGGPRGPSKRSTDPYIERFHRELPEILKGWKP